MWAVRYMALFVDPQESRRKPVTEWTDFSHLERAEQVVAAVPGGGWRAHWEEEAGALLTEPVLAWLITANGRATPITVEPNGYVDTAELVDRILAPGEDLA
jgi:hypothetical protein